MVSKKQNLSRTIHQSEVSIPGGNTLSLVAFRDGTKGFMAQSEDGAGCGFYDIDGERICYDPGFMMEIRSLGEYAPGDGDGFWALVARV